MPAGGPPGAVRVPGIEDAVDVAAGDEHGCALHRHGGVTCWGSGLQGNLGNGPGKPRGPARIPRIDDAVAITSEWQGYTTCVLRRSGVVSCWGLATWFEGNVIEAGPVDLPRFDDVTLVSLDGGEVCFADRKGVVRCSTRNDPATAGAGRSVKDYAVEIDVSTL
jgi:hypothetical protein